MQVMGKYRLELHWDSVDYPEDDVAVLRGAYFKGPVLQDAAELREEDGLILDMTAQHKILVPDYYQSTLSWKGIHYSQGVIFLKEVYIKGKYVNSLETLNNSDWILIDCKEHEERKHPFHLVYWAEVRKESGEEKL